MQRLNVNFFLKGDKTQNGLCAIYGKLKLGSTSCTFSTGKYISKEKWEKTNHLRNAIRKDIDISLKEYIHSMSLELEKAYTQHIKTVTTDKKITATDIKNLCFDTTVKKEITLLDLVNKHNNYFKMQVAKGDRADGSLEKYERMGEVLKEYLYNRYKVLDIEFDKIGSDFVFDLDHYIRFERKHGGKAGLGHNTTVKYIRNISSMINYTL